MSEVVNFDTHAGIKELAAAGIPKKQAEATVGVIVKVVNANVATKQDLVELELRLVEKLAELTRWAIIIGVALAGLILTFN